MQDSIKFVSANLSFELQAIRSKERIGVPDFDQDEPLKINLRRNYEDKHSIVQYLIEAITKFSTICTK